MQTSEIVVSIICITYNHEKYIAKALDGFLMQETNFKYEILLHDDASTDRTAQIIREYCDRYPGRIDAICQTENQHKKGVSPTMLLINKARGKYVAICEGDDYWTDKNKLQMQVECLEQHKECAACVHNVLVVQEDGTPWPEGYQSSYREETDQYKGIESLYNQCKFSHTASLLMYRSLFSDMDEDRKKEFKQLKANGDMKWAALIAACGGAYHIAKDMACYRYVVAGNDSWTARNKGVNISLKTYEQLERIKGFINKYYHVNLDYSGYYKKLCFMAGKTFVKSPNKKNFAILKELWKKNSYHVFSFGKEGFAIFKKKLFK